MAAALAVGVAAGCVGHNPPASRSAIGTISGSVVNGTFVQQGEAQLAPETPLAGIYPVGDAVYAITAKNKVYALSQGLDIRFLSQVVEPTAAVHPPVQVGEEVVFPTATNLTVVDKAGTQLRTVVLQHPLTSDVRVDQRGLILAGTAAPTGGRVAMIDPRRTVRPEQQQTLIGNVLSAPVSLQGIVFAATDRGRVYAIGGESTTAWGMEGMSFDTGRLIKADLVIDDFALYVPGGDGVLYALDRTTGRIKWRFMAELPLEAAPLLTKDRVFQVVPGIGLAALDKLEGKIYREPLWTAQGVTQVVSADDKFVYAVRGKGELVALGIADGQEKFSARGRFTFVAAGADNAIFAATTDGALVKLKRGPYSGEAMAGR